MTHTSPTSRWPSYFKGDDVPGNVKIKGRKFILELSHFVVKPKIKFDDHFRRGHKVTISLKIFGYFRTLSRCLQPFFSNFIPFIWCLIRLLQAHRSLWLLWKLICFLYRVFIKYCVLFQDFKIFRSLVYLCFPSMSVCVHTPGYIVIV